MLLTPPRRGLFPSPPRQQGRGAPPQRPGPPSPPTALPPGERPEQALAMPARAIASAGDTSGSGWGARARLFRPHPSLLARQVAQQRNRKPGLSSPRCPDADRALRARLLAAGLRRRRAWPSSTGWRTRRRPCPRSSPGAHPPPPPDACRGGCPVLTSPSLGSRTGPEERCHEAAPTRAAGGRCGGRPGAAAAGVRRATCPGGGEHRARTDLGCALSTKSATSAASTPSRRPSRSPRAGTPEPARSLPAASASPARAPRARTARPRGPRIAPRRASATAVGCAARPPSRLLSTADWPRASVPSSSAAASTATRHPRAARTPPSPSRAPTGRDCGSVWPRGPRVYPRAQRDRHRAGVERGHPGAGHHALDLDHGRRRLARPVWRRRNTDAHGRIVRRLTLTRSLLRRSESPITTWLLRGVAVFIHGLHLRLVAKPEVSWTPATNSAGSGTGVTIDGRHLGTALGSWNSSPRFRVNLQRRVGRHWRAVSESTIRSSAVATPLQGRNRAPWRGRRGHPASARSHTFVIRET